MSDGGRPRCASVGGWQPIETAPKDGREIIYRTKSGRVGSCYWMTARELADAFGGSPHEYDGSWIDERDEDEAIPAHWAPMFADPPERSEGPSRPST